jgi:hypothetical protein
VFVCAAGPASRLHQIVEWLGDGDYVIVLDECHKAKNAVRSQNQLTQFLVHGCIVFRLLRLLALAWLQLICNLLKHTYWE